VIAVDVIPDIDLQSNGDVPNHLSGWSYMWRKVNPFAPKLGMPNILSILMRSVMVASKDVLRAEERLTTLYLRPPVAKWNMLDFKSAEPLAEQGYRGTFDQIKAWWETARATHLVV
jgi:predicted acylesterase/phospholipase RssA